MQTRYIPDDRVTNFAFKIAGWDAPKSMIEILGFLTKYEVWIYILAGGIAIIYARKVVLALEERRAAVFGLERENANRQLASAGSFLGFMILLAVAEFVLVTFVSPFVPQAKDLPLRPSIFWRLQPLHLLPTPEWCSRVHHQVPRNL